MPEYVDPKNLELLFSPAMIGKKEAPNRFASQPMEGNDGENGGAVSERTLERYRSLARGAWGITVVEAISVTSDALARNNGLVINRKNLDSFKRLVDEFKKIHPEGILLFQISHAGRKAGPLSRKAGMYDDGSEGLEILSEKRVEEIRRNIVEGVNLSAEAGADGVDFKLCHGYLGSEILRPANQRNDKWGGSYENRTRFLFSSLQELKALHGHTDFIIGSRISMYEGIRGGCGTVAGDSVLEDLTEMKRLIAGMAEAGMDYLNVSAGIPGYTSEITRPTNQSRWFYLHHFRYCREAREVSGNMSLIGSAYTILKEESLSYGEENVKNGLMDFIGYGRQSFADPLFPAKILNGEPVNYCTACSGCTKLMIRQVNDGCVIFDSYYREMLKSTSKR